MEGSLRVLVEGSSKLQMCSRVEEKVIPNNLGGVEGSVGREAIRKRLMTLLVIPLVVGDVEDLPLVGDSECAPRLKKKLFLGGVEGSVDKEATKKRLMTLFVIPLVVGALTIATAGALVLVSGK
ncbi:hypothetical protein ACLOJK_038257 [Asimina triloba]